MRITKCDICKKSIERKDEVNISVGGILSGYFDICGNCAKPLLKFLKSKKLIEENKKKKLRMITKNA